MTIDYSRRSNDAISQQFHPLFIGNSKIPYHLQHKNTQTIETTNQLIHSLGIFSMKFNRNSNLIFHNTTGNSITRSSLALILSRFEKSTEHNYIDQLRSPNSITFAISFFHPSNFSSLPYFLSIMSIHGELYVEIIVFRRKRTWTPKSFQSCPAYIAINPLTASLCHCILSIFEYYQFVVS